MLTFRPYSFDAFRALLPILRRYKGLCNDLCAGSLFMWQQETGLQFALYKGTLTLRQNIGDQPAFSYPIGDDPDGMIDELLRYTAANNLALRFFAVDEATLAAIRADDRLASAMWSYNRKWSDYLYAFDEALTFTGKKFNGQRNHINKFTRLYGEPVVRPLCREDRPLVDEMLALYAAEHTERSALESAELANTRRLLDCYDELGLYGACLTVGEKIIAFSIGEVVGDTLFIHIEKALRQYEGAYPAMYRGFVRLVGERLGRPLTYVNREDDSGDPGLRTSKTQYHPVALVHKYLVHVNSPAAKLGDPPVLRADGLVLTPIRETDKAAYRELNTDLDNNKYWGYDYREDGDLTLPVDDDTFYDAVRRDMAAGDSVNFAIRFSEDGEMIGEGVLWQFTANGRAEIGCRLFARYHGKGWGKAAFSAMADYAASLGLMCRARCYAENIASHRMILASGFRQICYDGDFFYFARPCCPPVAACGRRAV